MKQITDEAIAELATHYMRIGDSERVNKEGRIEDLRATIDNDLSRIEYLQQEMQSRTEDVESYKILIEQIQDEITKLPPPPTVTPEEVRANITRALSLAYVKSISIDGRNIIVTTRVNALYTTLERKYSRAERWYKVKPYKIALPSYRIRIGVVPAQSLSNKTDALALTLNEYTADTAHFLPWVNRYSHEPHAHWGTTSARASDEYRGICLGEYESEVTKAFKISLTDGLIALAIYLQSAGTDHAYINKRELWALWMGKHEYNRALVPSEKELQTLTEDEDGSDYCDCRVNSDDECNDDDCECDCHL